MIRPPSRADFTVGAAARRAPSKRATAPSTTTNTESPAMQTASSDTTVVPRTLTASASTSVRRTVVPARLTTTSPADPNTRRSGVPSTFTARAFEATRSQIHTSLPPMAAAMWRALHAGAIGRSAEEKPGKAWSCSLPPRRASRRRSDSAAVRTRKSPPSATGSDAGRATSMAHTRLPSWALTA